MSNAAELRREAKELLENGNGDGTPLPLPAWLSIVNQTVKLASKENPEGFLTWKPINRTMHLRAIVPHISAKLKWIRKLDKYKSRWREALVENVVGSPAVFSQLGNSSGSRILQVYHLAQLEQKTGIRLWDHGQILEFGGGYGNMMLLCQQLGFDDIPYLIYDLPIFSAIQRYYLAESQVPELWYQCVSTHEDWMEGIRGDRIRAHFLAMQSFAETPIEHRVPIEEQLRLFDTIFISFADIYHRMNNMVYFLQLMENYPEYEWNMWRMDERPQMWYLAGMKKEYSVISGGESSTSSGTYAIIGEKS